ncbi:MAG: reverse transcriptase family protein [Micropepsaceae bacterium]
MGLLIRARKLFDAGAAMTGGIIRILILLGLIFAVHYGWRWIQRQRHKKVVAEFKKAPTRDVSTVAGEGAADLKSEKIQIGGPLKPNHRRQALRDDRLLPKPPLGPDYYSKWPRPPKPRYFTEADADRLFSPSLRTTSRDVMDLATDEEQLKRYGLPLLRSEADIANAVGMPLGKFRHYAQHRHREQVSHYVAFAIPKRDGSERIIHAPKTKLKALQRALDKLLVSKLPISEHAHGFVKGRSIATNARAHVGKPMVAKFDIKDCFPTLHIGRVRGLFLALGYSYPVAAALAVVMTEAPRQRVEAEGRLYHTPTGPRVCVQGAPTSPGLCNAILLRLDRRLAGLAKKRGLAYTRYADDLTFSGSEAQVKKLLGIVPKIAAEEGFEINAGKTRLMRQSGRQAVTGVIVNKDMGLSRETRRKLRAALHHKRMGKTDAPAAARLTGQLAYLHMLNPEQAARLQEARGGSRTP